MEHVTREITREYRLDFNGGETGWDDPIRPEATSLVLGRRATCTISRTSLLAWSLMTISAVQVADLTCEGWIKIVISIDADFDEVAFRSELAKIVADVRDVPGTRPSWRRDAARPVYIQAAAKDVAALGSVT